MSAYKEFISQVWYILRQLKFNDTAVKDLSCDFNSKFKQLKRVNANLFAFTNNRSSCRQLDISQNKELPNSRHRLKSTIYFKLYFLIVIQEDTDFLKMELLFPLQYLL